MELGLSRQESSCIFFFIADHAHMSPVDIMMTQTHIKSSSFKLLIVLYSIQCIYILIHFFRTNPKANVKISSKKKRLLLRDLKTLAVEKCTMESKQ